MRGPRAAADLKLHHDVERDQAARGRSGRTPGSAARIVLDVLDEREPDVRHEMPAPRRSQPMAWWIFRARVWAMVTLSRRDVLRLAATSGIVAGVPALAA